ncbi:unnamed protein product [Tetraodon nigroviridis]|uniref:(spotted green pufferfish) hypothetical protein n=1 Tax=Tetraodon nigroviridis TaxID=99883 RepID=Q4RM92_TETNG|nr:unnamed protein product [Tetraodon nigroviridis]
MMFLMGRRLTGSQAHNTWDYEYYKRELQMSVIMLVVSDPPEQFPQRVGKMELAAENTGLCYRQQPHSSLTTSTIELPIYSGELFKSVHPPLHSNAEELL